MQPYERSELGEVGEGLCPADSAIPLTAATRHPFDKLRAAKSRNLCSSATPSAPQRRGEMCFPMMGCMWILPWGMAA
jgi:hypothetical protein